MDFWEIMAAKKNLLVRQQRAFENGLSASFVTYLCYFCLVLVMLSWASAYWCLVVSCWERAGLLALVFDVY